MTWYCELREVGVGNWVVVDDGFKCSWLLRGRCDSCRGDAVCEFVRSGQRLVDCLARTCRMFSRRCVDWLRLRSMLSSSSTPQVRRARSGWGLTLSIGWPLLPRMIVAVKLSLKPRTHSMLVLAFMSRYSGKPARVRRLPAEVRLSSPS